MISLMIGFMIGFGRYPKGEAAVVDHDGARTLKVIYSDILQVIYIYI